MYSGDRREGERWRRYELGKPLRSYGAQSLQRWLREGLGCDAGNDSVESDTIRYVS